MEIEQITNGMANCNLNGIDYKSLCFKLQKKLNKKNFIIDNLKSKINELNLEILEKDKYIVASKTAKNGFKEEDLVIKDINQNLDLFNNLENFVGISLGKFYKNKGTTKTDITDGNLKIQVKKHKENQFGQIDRHYLSYFFEKIPELTKHKKLLEGMCCLPLLDNQKCDKSKNIIKLSSKNYTNQELNDLITDLNKEKNKVIQYALLGYDNNYKPDILLGIEYDKENNRNKMIFYKMNEVIKYLNTQEFKIRKSGTVIELGDTFTLQRKGGDSGKKTANHLQFKLVFSKLKLDEKLIFKL